MEAGQVQSRPGRAGQLLCVSVSSHCQVLRAEAAARARPGRGPRQRVAPSLSLPWRLQPPATRSLRRTRSSSGLGRKPPNVAAERAEYVDRAAHPFLNRLRLTPPGHKGCWDAARWGSSSRHQVAVAARPPSRSFVSTVTTLRRLALYFHLKPK